MEPHAQGSASSPEKLVGRLVLMEAGWPREPTGPLAQGAPSVPRLLGSCCCGGTVSQGQTEPGCSHSEDPRRTLSCRVSPCGTSPHGWSPEFALPALGSPLWFGPTVGNQPPVGNPSLVSPPTRV